MNCSLALPVSSTLALLNAITFGASSKSTDWPNSLSVSRCTFASSLDLKLCTTKAAPPIPPTSNPAVPAV